MHRPYTYIPGRLNHWLRQYGCLLAVSVMLVMGQGCSDQLTRQEKLANLPDQLWPQRLQPWIHMQIQDSTIAYRLYAVIRHTEAFKYDNLLLRYGYIAPGDSAVYHEVNLPLAKNDQWLGDTLGSIIETRVRLNRAPQKMPVGDNGFVLQHMMPDEPLVGILQIGIRLEAVSLPENGTVAGRTALPDTDSTGGGHRSDTLISAHGAKEKRVK